MSVIDTLTRQAGRLAEDLQHGVRRARLEGERRVLQRQHRAALETLGSRVYELVRAGHLPDGEIAPELATVENKLMEIDAKSTEIDALRSDADPSADDPVDPGLDAARRFSDDA
jgi:hypothetical protein